MTSDVTRALSQRSHFFHVITRDALKGHTVSKNGSISFFFFFSFYAGCPEGAYRVLKRVDFFFFFFVVVTNRYINLFIKLSPLLLGMYCSDCLQQRQANQNPFLSLISRGRGPTHPYLCDVNASFDIFINDGLNSRAILLKHVLDSSVPFSNGNFTILKP